MEQYAIYLRKSRADKEFEAQSELETLSRHEAILKALAEKKKLRIGKIYKEVVSGETITSRPAMQELLRDVEQGMWDGVLVMEIERLARGDTIDQGLVARTFKYSDTLIVTPNKTYNPSNEFDEEYLEFGLFMSRREYKTITRRLQIGRHQAVKEGKFGAGFAPFGYKKVKLKGERGYTLEIVPEEAEIVRKIYDWYINGDNGKVMGLQAIAVRLHDMGVKTATGITTWRPATIRNLIDNPVYAGKVRWQAFPEKKIMLNGEVVKKVQKKFDYETYDGLHEAIIDEETFNAVKRKRIQNRNNTFPKSKGVQNPLCGLVICAKCGGFILRRKHSKRNEERLLCENPYCDNISSKMEIVEKSVINGLQAIVNEYEIKQENNADNNSILMNAERYRQEKAVCKAKKEVLQKQLTKVYEAYEQGIYDSDIFLERSAKIKDDIADINEQIGRIDEEITKAEGLHRQQELFIPKVKNVIDIYYDLPTAEEKNKLLKQVIEKITYLKEKRLSLYKSNQDDIQITIYPKISGDFL